MTTINTVILVGRLVRDPAVRYSSGDNPVAVARFTVAVDRKGQKVEGKPTADFINCIALGKRGEFADRWLRQGTKIVLRGHIQTDKYTKDDGQTVYTTDVVADEIEFAESKRQGDAPAEQPKQTEGPKADDGFASIPDDLEVDMPFR